MADLHGTRPPILWLCIRDYGCRPVVETVATAAPKATNLEIAHRPGAGLLKEISRSAVPIDLRAIRQLQRSPLAVDLCVWLTYRMSYLKKPTLIPWRDLQGQFGVAYTRPRDFRCRVSNHLEAVLRIYPTVRLSLTDPRLRLDPSPPHVRARVRREVRGSALRSSEA